MRRDALFLFGAVLCVLALVRLDHASGEADRVMSSIRRLRPCKLDSPSIVRDTTPDELKCELVADFLVVGTGAGGAALLRKLSDGGKHSVLGFEAGQNFDDDPNVSDPNLNAIPSMTSVSTYGWQMKSALMTGIGKVVDVSAGRMLGGSTSHNGMLYVKGSPMYLSTWVNYGGSAWSPANISATFQAMENHSLALAGRGVGGPVDVKRSPVGPTSGPGAFAHKITEWTATASGIPATPDYNGASQPYGPYPRFDLFVTPDGRRESSSNAFLGDDAMHANGTGVGSRKLRVLFKATVTRVLFRGGRAVGVEFVHEGIMKRAYAKKEVILAAGLFSTQILQNSGVGDATRLASLGIPVVYDNPLVGEGLSNHPYVFLTLTTNASDTPTTFPDHAGLSGGFFMPKWHANLSYSPADLSLPRKFHNAWVTLGSGLAGAITTLMQPKSTGYDRVQSNDPLQVPLHDEGTFTHADDADDFAAFLYYFYQQTLIPYLQSQDAAYGPLGWGGWAGVNDAKAWLMQNVVVAAHYSGQNRMGTSAATGVVDFAGRVYGVDRLRVADSTVIPVVPDGNTAAITMMVGCRVADLLRQQYG